MSKGLVDPAKKVVMLFTSPYQGENKKRRPRAA